jgi:hypothetical protein
MNNEALKAILDAIEPMKNNRLGNYIIPGVASHLIGGGDHGKVRLFSAARSARDFVTPHSHRFDFTCLVLSGVVRNTIYHPSGSHIEPWCMSTIDQVCGENGLRDYVHTRSEGPSYWLPVTTTYREGDTYAMQHDEIHSIQFDRGTQVLFFEGPQVTAVSCMLEPWVDGQCVPTFKTESWMFRR